MYWNWEDPTGKVSLKVKPSWFCRDSSDHVVFLKNDTDMAISQISFGVDYFDRKGRVIEKGHSNIFFHQVAAHSEHKSDFMIEKRLKVKSGAIQFVNDRDPKVIDPLSIHISHSPWEAFRVTIGKFLAAELCVLAMMAALPILNRMGKIPDFTPARKIESCLQQKDGYRPEVFVKKDSVAVRYFYARQDTPTQEGFYQISIPANTDGHQAGSNQTAATIDKGGVSYSGKYRELDVEQSWTDSGSTEPQATDIRNIRYCTTKVFSQNAYTPR